MALTGLKCLGTTMSTRGHVSPPDAVIAQSLDCPLVCKWVSSEGHHILSILSTDMNQLPKEHL